MSSAKITEANFNLTATSGKPHDKNPQVLFRRAYPDAWLMIRPDRPGDGEAHCYPDKDAKARGDRAMKVWFEYLASKGFIRTFNAWRGLLKSGKSIMVVCDDPAAFEPEFVWPAVRPMYADFWDDFEQSRIPVDRRYEDPRIADRCRVLIADLASDLRMKRPGAKIVEETVLERPLREWKQEPLESYVGLQPPNISDELRLKLVRGGA